MLEISLCDLSIELLQGREGSVEGASLWDEVIAAEADLEKASLLEILQNVLDLREHSIPAIAERIAQVRV